MSRLALACILLLAGFESPLLASDAVSFERTIRPILKQHCWHCHGEEAKLEGGLDTRLARSLRMGGESGPALQPGNHAASLLIEKIESGEMPPGEKKVSPTQLEALKLWIDQGAEVQGSEPESLPVGEVILQSDRDHWAFRPIARAPYPETEHQARWKTGIDPFLLSKLETRGLHYGPEASRAMLVRRVFMDLIGLPPRPDELADALTDESPDWYEQLIDRLLSSPAYGERWGRHWLDIAGYADSNGYTEKDSVRKWAWRYRDYVIQSLNNDKPWNQFIIEQLAGDELIESSHDNLSPEQADKLIATGFLRMVPDGTGDGGVDMALACNEVVAENIKVVSSSLLGLTVGCAQCHSHRYDPISQADYYRFRAIFEPALNVKNWKKPDQRLISLWSKAIQEESARVEKELKEVADNRKKELEALVEDTFEKELAKLPEEIREPARKARMTKAAEQTDEQKELIKQYPFLNVDTGSVYLYLPDRLNGFNKKWEQATEEVQKKRPREDRVHALWEPPQDQVAPPDTFVFYRGDHQSPRDKVLPAELSILNPEGKAIDSRDGKRSTGRRLAYAQRLTSGSHPLVGRVLVNRFWMHHFGRGLVANPTDFGLASKGPSHPELLDWIADEFVRQDWSLKQLHRTILLSSAYRQTSESRKELEEVDPNNELLGRMPLRRLEAETVRDAVLYASGRLSTKRGGPPIEVSPDEVGQFVIAVDTRDSAGRPSGKKIDLQGEELRRSIYVQVRRSMPLSVLEPFDSPVMTPNCGQRSNSTVATQSLMLMNHEFLIDQSKALAIAVEQAIPSTELKARIRLCWQQALAREPSSAELERAEGFLLGRDQPTTEEEKTKSSSTEAMQQRLTQYCHALFCSNPFLYVE